MKLIMAYKHRKYPEWSWSLSRHRTFKKCLRKYYYQYYKSHNGWEWDAPEENKKVYRLKKLQSIDSILGNSIHHLLHQIIHDGFPLNRSVLNKKIKKALNDVVRSSQNKPAWEVNPSNHTMLKEVYYNDQLSERKIEKIKYKKEQILNYLLNTDIIENIKDSYYIKSFDTSTFENFDFKGTKVYAIPDLIYKKTKDKKPNIIDWKTGKQKNSEIDQLKLYAYYYYNEYDYNGIIDTSFIYLYEQSIDDYQFGEEIISEVENKMNKSLKEMKEYLKEEKWNRPLEENEFERRANDIVCSYCKFRELCGR